MASDTSNLPAEKLGESSAAGSAVLPRPSGSVPAPGSEVAYVASTRSEAADNNACDGRLKNATSVFQQPYAIYAFTGLALSVFITAIFYVPDAQIAGRVGCLLGAALSYYVGARWLHASSQIAISKSNHATALADDDLDQKMEQLEDAKWQLNDSAARYRDLLDHHQDMIIRLDAAGDLTFANRAFCRKFALRFEDIVGARLGADLIQAIVSSDIECEGPRIPSRRRVMETSDGSRLIEWSARRVATDNGSDVQYTGRDVTEMAAAQKALEDARDEAQIANRSKSRFLASMSHEIRTPMNGILGMANLLNDEKLSKQQKTYVGAIELSARNLLNIIDEILDFSKIEAGKIRLYNHYFSVEDTALSVVELLAPVAQEKGLEIAWTVDQCARGEFFGDATRVRQVLMNLVSNAVKFTDEGGIRVSVKAVDPVDSDQDPMSHIEIRVSDTGVGLTQEEQDSLFAEFAQSDQALKRQAGGTGLGLAISRRLTEAMGGGLTVESVVGQGSTFVARMRLKPVIGASVGHNFANLQRFLNLKVLLAFDRAIERAALAEVLRDGGIGVVECTLEDASSIVTEAGRNKQPFTRVIVDADEDPDVAEQLLKCVVAAAVDAGLSKSDVRSVFLVGISSRDALPVYKDRGFDSYIVRPVRPKTLFEQLLSERAGAPEQDPSAAGKRNASQNSADPQFSGPLRFLLVEDNDINALLVVHQLQRAGHYVERVCDGVSALGQMQDVLARTRERFDVILMDVLLPQMDGLETTEKIRSLFAEHNRDYARPPVIALTANAFDEDRDRCLAAGMDDYLAKPFDRDMLNAVLARCLNQA